MPEYKVDFGVTDLKVVGDRAGVQLLRVQLNDDDGRLIGVIKGWSDYPESKQMYITNVEVLPPYQGQGYGRALYERFIEEALQAGFESVQSYPGRSEAATRVWRSLSRESRYRVEHDPQDYWVVRAHRRSR